jgi:hypothetical protein
VWDVLKPYVVEIVALAGAMLLMAVLATLRKLLMNRRPPAIVRFNEANLQIHQLLTETRVRLSADRVFVVQFRNGSRFDTEAPIFRIYMTHEVVGRGIAPVTFDWSGIGASQVYEILSVLWPKTGAARSGQLPCDDCQKKNDCIKHPSEQVARMLEVRSLQEGMLKSMLIQQGTYHLMLAPMRDGKDIVGYVGADFREQALVPVANACDYMAHTAANSMYELKRAISDTRRTILGRFWHHLWQTLIARRAGTDD